MEVTAYPVEPLTVEDRNHSGQYAIKGMSPGKDFDEQYVAISGYFGSWGPHVFAAAPDLLEPAKRYIAQIDAIGLPDDEVTSLFRAAIAKAEGRS